jgi:hypothetical protein
MFLNKITLYRSRQNKKKIFLCLYKYTSFKKCFTSKLCSSDHGVESFEFNNLLFVRGVCSHSPPQNMMNCDTTVSWITGYRNKAEWGICVLISSSRISLKPGNICLCVMERVGSFCVDKGGQNVKVVSCLQIVPTLRVRGALVLPPE